MDHVIALFSLVAFGYTWRVSILYLPSFNKWLKELVSFACGMLVLLTIFSIYSVATEKYTAANPLMNIGDKNSQTKE